MIINYYYIAILILKLLDRHVISRVIVAIIMSIFVDGAVYMPEAKAL